jgi:hypothetical protein
MSDERHSRRRMLGFLGAGAAGLVAGGVATRRLRGEEPPVAGPPPRQAPPPPTTTTTVPPTTTTRSLLPEVDPYETVAGEVFVEPKTVAARVVEGLLAYRVGVPVEEVVERVTHLTVGDLDRARFAERAATLVVPEAESVGIVVYPQLGGLDPHSSPVRCSVMVVAEHHLARRSEPAWHWSRCLDVRLRVDEGGWRVEGLEDLSPGPVARPAVLSEIAERALGHPALELPDAARWDIHEGIVDERVLAELVSLADELPVRVTSFRRGHPDNVFGTNRTSAHTVGRAVDIWSVGDRPVVQQQPDRATTVHALYQGGRVHNLGAPWSFGPGSFTDPVHHDHLHLGVSA